MSKLYLEYLKRKKENNDKYYLFKTGLFYIFIDEDARNISKITPLNITNLSNEVVKCGFPSNSLEKYLNIFKNLRIDVEIINGIDKQTNKNISKKIIKKIKNLDINTLTPVKALYILIELKGLIENE